MIEQATIYLLAAIGLISCILFAFVWLCMATRVMWLYFSWNLHNAIRARSLARRIKKGWPA
ncbi:hypothetical protein EGJ48_03555 [Pantoea dispersa]|nr:hypothetical protein EGJ48_03555 [Pantoea dispersa]